MGKRKSAKKPVAKRNKEVLCAFVRKDELTPATVFKCLFCHHDNSVSVKMCAANE